MYFWHHGQGLRKKHGCSSVYSLTFCNNVCFIDAFSLLVRTQTLGRRSSLFPTYILCVLAHIYSIQSVTFLKSMRYIAQWCLSLTGRITCGHQTTKKRLNQSLQFVVTDLWMLFKLPVYHEIRFWHKDLSLHKPVLKSLYVKIHLS